MIVCPKCNQMSQNDKVCTNCWSDLTGKSHVEKAPRDLTKMPLRNIIIVAVAVIVFGLVMRMLAGFMVH